MSGVSEYGATAWAGLMFGIGALPDTFYIALCTDVPGSGWDGTVLATVEPQGSATYFRSPVLTPSGWALSDNGYVVNAGVLEFPLPDVDWGQIGYFALVDAITAGNLWAFGEFSTPIAVPAGYDLSIPIAGITVGVAELLPSIAE